MSRKTCFRILATLVCAIAIVSIASAHELSLKSRGKIANGPELQPGTYQIKVVKNQDSAEVRFFKKGDMVAKATAKISPENTKAYATEVNYEEADGGQVITLIRLQGSKESLVFKSDAPKPE